MRVFSCLTIVVAALTGCVTPGMGTPLDDYVNRPDPTYSFSEISERKADTYTIYTINMTSQKWMNEDIVDRPVWWHYLSITVPHNIIHKNAAVLFIDGGSNNDGPPEPSDEFVTLTTLIAASTGTIGANLKMIPNQPLTFKADPSAKKRSEDAIIAWTWKTFVENPNNTEILLRMPMTKAAVRAMDTVSSVTKSKIGMEVNKFFVAGASKRGWTTWTTAAVDKRVIAFAPLVMDLLNMQQNLHHFWRAYGGWTFAFDDYYDLNFTQQLDNPNIKKMAAIVDPISYNDRFLNRPKMVVSTGGDEFFLPDDSHYYFDKLLGPKYLRMLPNAEHSLAGHVISLTFSLRAFYLQALTNTPLPQMEWTRSFTTNGGKIVLKTKTTPTTVTSFYARTLDANRRDFRLLVKDQNTGKPVPHPVLWIERPVTSMGNNTFSAEFTNPEKGWLAFFIQVTFPGVDEAAVLEFTTETQIIPNTFPYPDCKGANCRGSLL